MKHYYKGFVLERNGTQEMPWNIYYPPTGSKYGEWIECGRTMKECKRGIDAGCFNEEVADIEERYAKRKAWRERNPVNIEWLK